MTVDDLIAALEDEEVGAMPSAFIYVRVGDKLVPVDGVHVDEEGDVVLEPES